MSPERKKQYQKYLKHVLSEVHTKYTESLEQHDKTKSLHPSLIKLEFEAWLINVGILKGFSEADFLW